jgi:membrane-associated protease RseP (regulator of RpoE activity)
MESFVIGSLLIAGIAAVLLIHELGHLLVARYFGFKVLSLSIGWGPQLLSFTDGFGTIWRIRAIPIGGSCGLDNNSGPKKVRRGLRSQTSQEALIYASGPAFNLIFAACCGLLVPMLCTNCALYGSEMGSPGATAIRLVAELSVCTALFNLLPVLPLDGGRLCLTAIEAAVGRQMSEKCENWFYGPSMVLIAGITVAYLAWTAATFWQFGAAS